MFIINYRRHHQQPAEDSRPAAGPDPFLHVASLSSPPPPLSAQWFASHHQRDPVCSGTSTTNERLTLIISSLTSPSGQAPMGLYSPPPDRLHADPTNSHAVIQGWKPSTAPPASFTCLVRCSLATAAQFGQHLSWWFNTQPPGDSSAVSALGSLSRPSSPLP